MNTQQVPNEFKLVLANIWNREYPCKHCKLCL